jgi:hypothetical protein
MHLARNELLRRRNVVGHLWSARQQDRESGKRQWTEIILTRRFSGADGFEPVTSSLRNMGQTAVTRGNVTHF